LVVRRSTPQQVDPTAISDGPEVPAKRLIGVEPSIMSRFENGDEGLLPAVGKIFRRQPWQALP
jgi:hypothetical protein